MNTTKTLLLAIFSSLLLAVPAFALDLQQAKSDGLVGELVTGYLGSPQAQPSSEVKELITDINEKRKAKYQQLAKSQGLPLASIETLAGEKSFEKTASGHFINVPGSGWKKK